MGSREGEVPVVPLGGLASWGWVKFFSSLDDPRGREGERELAGSWSLRLNQGRSSDGQLLVVG